MSVSSLSSLDGEDRRRQRTINISSEDSDQEHSEAPTSSDPEYSNDLWEVEKIRGHWPPKAKSGDRCFYYVQWKLKKRQIEDWSDEENWIPNTGMMLKSYWTEVDRDIQKGRKPLKIYPPDKVVHMESDQEIAKKIAVKQSRKYHKKSTTREEGSKYVSSDDEEEELVERRSKKRASKSVRFHIKRKEPTWQEKINLPDDEYFIDKDDDIPVVLSDEERPNAIREAAKRDAEAKQKNERKRRSESETKREEKEKRYEVIRKLDAERRRRKASLATANNNKNRRKEKNLQIGEPKRRTVDNHYETVASPSVINKLRKELDNRQNNAGHWKAKESLIEEHPTTSRKSITRHISEPHDVAGSSHTHISSVANALDTDFNICHSKSHFDRNTSETELHSDQEECLPPKRKKPVYVSSNSEDASEHELRKSIKEEKFDDSFVTCSSQNLRNIFSDGHSFSKTAHIDTTKKSHLSSRDMFKKTTCSSDSSIDSLFDNVPCVEKKDSDLEIEPLIKDLKTDDLVIADQDEESFSTKNNENTDSQPCALSHGSDNHIFMNMIEQFIADCWTQKYALQRKLKPVYVFLFASYNETDYAMTVFENETEVEPMYICECVPAVDVWNTNKQLIIDAERRLRQSEWELPRQLNLPSKRPIRGVTPRNR